MNPNLDLANIEQGKAFLSQIRDTYSAIIDGAHLEQESENMVACTLEIPGFGKKTATATSSIEAIHLALVELTFILTKHQLPDSAILMNQGLSSTVESSLTDGTRTERFRSKTRQLTIGVTIPTPLKEYLTSIIDQQQLSFAEVARKLAVLGLEDFTTKSLFESPHSLFEMLENALSKWKGSSTEQVMLRLDPRHAIRMRSAAKEYNRSASELGVLCIAHGISLQEQLVTLEDKVASFKGAAIRPLLTEVRLDNCAASLLSGVLVGSISAPRALIKRLANVFCTSETLLAMLFKRSFDNRILPSFKAENGKPEISKLPTPWDTAVRSLKLSQEQTNALLELGR